MTTHRVLTSISTGPNRKSYLKEVVLPIAFANPVDFFGINDSNLELIRKKFPGLKIVSRGTEIKIKVTRKDKSLELDAKMGTRGKG